MKKVNKLTVFLLAGLAFAFIFAACEPIEGSFEEVRGKAEAETEGGDKTVTVTFDINGGTVTSGSTAPTAMAVDRNSLIVLPDGTSFSKSGSAFGGWNTKASGAGSNFEAGANYSVTGNTKLYAKWNGNCTVTFYANGGGGTVPTQPAVAANTTITLPSGTGLTQVGYVFGGWYTNSAGTGIKYTDGSSYTVTGNTEFYAKWNEACTIKFLANGGSGALAPSDIIAGKGDAVLLPGSNGLTSAGKSFDGWQIDGTGTTYPAGYPYAVTLPLTTLYAKWSDSYTITYNINGGSGTTPASTTENTGNPVALAGGAGFSRAGTGGADPYTFAGWNTNSAGTGTNYSASSIYSDGAGITLYAKWTSAVTYDNNGGSGTGVSAVVTPGNSVSLHSGSGFTRSGYTFYRWNTKADGTGTDLAAGASYIPTGNITLYAKWGRKVTFNTSGAASTPDPQTVENGAKVAQPTGVTNGSYILEGWYKESSFANKWDFNAAVTAEMTLYAKWTSTITYNINGGSGTTPSSVTVTAGSSTTLNSGSGLTRRGYGFGGWNTNAAGTGTNYGGGASYPPTGNITLYAKWNELNDPVGATLAEKLNWIALNSRTGGDYTITVTADESLGVRSFTTGVGYTNYKVTLVGSAAYTISFLSSTINSMFTINNGVTLVLDNNITLEGHSSNNMALVRAYEGGALVMNTGSKITGNTNTSGSGGGVYVTGSSSTFTMNGGIISNNNCSQSNGSGGGVCVVSGAFTMNGGTISDNTSAPNNTSISYGGGGVYVTGSSSTFTMNGGTISGNTAGYSGGGVAVFSGAHFTLNGASAAITGNSSMSGGGVLAYGANTTFDMISGEISGNNATIGSGTIGGGGVNVGLGSAFNLSGGTISGNTVTSNSPQGGGVYTNGGTFTMTGGIISGNTLICTNAMYAFYGGGVCVSGVTSSIFSKTGGTIFGYTSGDPNSNVTKYTNGNIATGCGAAVYAGVGASTVSRKRQESTAGPTVYLYYANTVASGDWEY